MVNTRAEVLDRIRGKKADLVKFCIVRIGIFGSAARDELNEKSDIDVVVEFSAGNANLTNFMGVKFMLEDEFGRRVDLATVQSLNKPYLRESVAQDMLYVT